MIAQQIDNDKMKRFDADIEVPTRQAQETAPQPTKKKQKSPKVSQVTIFDSKSETDTHTKLRSEQR